MGAPIIRLLHIIDGVSIMIIKSNIVFSFVYILACLPYLLIYKLSNTAFLVMVVDGFQGTGTTMSLRPPYGTFVHLSHENRHCPRQPFVLYDTTTGMSSSSLTTELEEFLQQEHTMFYALLLYKNEDVWKKIRDSTVTKNGACTIFAPTNAAMEALGDKKIQQLRDNRNEEVRNKMGSFHIVVDDDTVVTTEQLYNSGGIRTIATGDNPIVPVERNKRSGGNIFAMFTKSENDDDDGTVVLGSNNARIVNSIYLKSSNTLIHQMDALISPNILWRYCDQLRIPGSK